MIEIPNITIIVPLSFNQLKFSLNNKTPQKNIITKLIPINGYALLSSKIEMADIQRIPDAKVATKAESIHGFANNLDK